MKTFLCVIVGAVLSVGVDAQHHLVSFYNFYSEVHGGMEDSGISRNEAYSFLVKANITIKDIYFEGRELTLKKGDTLVINISLFTRYRPEILKPDSIQVNEIRQPTELTQKPHYKVFQSGRKYFANVQYPFIWDRTVSYSYRNKIYTSTAKDGFDGGATGYAP